MVNLAKVSVWCALVLTSCNQPLPKTRKEFAPVKLGYEEMNLQGETQRVSEVTDRTRVTRLYRLFLSDYKPPKAAAKDGYTESIWFTDKTGRLAEFSIIGWSRKTLNQDGISCTVSKKLAKDIRLIRIKSRVKPLD